MSRTLQRLDKPCHCGWKYVGFHLCTPPEKMEEARKVHPIKKPKTSSGTLSEQEKIRKRERYHANAEDPEFRERKRAYDRKSKAKKRAAERAVNPPVEKIYTCTYDGCTERVPSHRSKYCPPHRSVVDKARWKKYNDLKTARLREAREAAK